MAHDNSAGQGAFNVLRPVCVALVECIKRQERGSASRSEPSSTRTPEEHLRTLLEGFTEVVESVERDGLDLCIEYALFPLLLILTRRFTAHSLSASTWNDITTELALQCVRRVLELTVARPPELVKELLSLLLSPLNAAATSARARGNTSEASEDLSGAPEVSAEVAIVSCAALKGLVLPLLSGEHCSSLLLSLDDDLEEGAGEDGVEDPPEWDVRRELSDDAHSNDTCITVKKSISAAHRNVLDRHREEHASSRELLVSEKMLGARSCLVCGLVDLSAWHVTRGVVASSLETLHVLCNVLMSCGDSGLTVLRQFTPGICSGLGRTLTREAKQGHRVFVTALDTLCDVLVFVANEESVTAQIMHTIRERRKDGSSIALLEQVRAEAGVIVEGAKSDGLEKLEMNAAERTASETSVHLSSLCDKVFCGANRREHSGHWLNRVWLGNAAAVLLRRCPTVLRDARGTLVECLLCLLNDPFADVDHVARAALEDLIPREEQLSRNILMPNLLKLLERVPTMVHSAHDAEKRETLQLISNHMEVLASCLERNMNMLLNPLTEAAVAMLELDLESVISVVASGTSLPTMRDVTTRHLTPASAETSPVLAPDTQYPRFHFRHFRDDAIAECVRMVCRKIGYACANTALKPLHQWFSLLVPATSRSSTARMRTIALLMMINEFLNGVGEAVSKGIVDDGSEVLRELSSNTIETLLDQSLVIADANKQEEEITPEKSGYLGQYNSEQNRERHSASLSTISTVATCIIAKTIGDIAKLMGKRFNEFRLQVLFPLVQWLGDPRHLVAESARSALHRVCWYTAVRATSHDAAIAKLVALNLDYLIDTAVHRMMRISIFPHTPYVLRSVLVFADVREILRSMPLLMQEVLEVVFRALTLRNMELTSMSIGIIHSALLVVQKIYNVDKDEMEREAEAAVPDRDDSPLQRDDDDDEAPVTLQEYVDRLRSSERPAEAVAPGMADMSEEEKAPLPPALEMVESILKLLPHLIPLEDRTSRSLVIESASIGIELLGQRHQDALLPLAHLLWEPLLSRVKGMSTSLADEQVGIHKQVAPIVGGVEARPGLRSNTSSDESKAATAIDVLKCIAVMAVHCGNFIRKRFFQELWPVLALQLPKHTAQVLSLRSGSSASNLQATPSFKLIVEMMKSIAIVGSSVELSANELIDIAETFAPFLDVHQELRLQTLAVELVTMLAMENKSALFLFIHSAAGIRELDPPEGLRLRCFTVKIPKFQLHRRWRSHMKSARLLQTERRGGKSVAEDPAAILRSALQGLDCTANGRKLLHVYWNTQALPL